VAIPDIINAVPDMDRKRYLELGVFQGATFGTVRANEKFSVDAKYPATFQMTTDDFFAHEVGDEVFDVIYIDACHEFRQVVRDYNHSVEHLASGGVIFLHDMIPTCEAQCAPQFSGDAYKLLHYILTTQRDLTCWFLPPEPGLCGFTCIPQPVPLDPPPCMDRVTYEELRVALAGLPCETCQSMAEKVSKL